MDESTNMSHRYPTCLKKLFTKNRILLDEIFENKTSVEKYVNLDWCGELIVTYWYSTLHFYEIIPTT